MNITIQGKIDKQYNRTWAPIINSLVIIDHPKYVDNLFLGFIHKYLWEMEACLVLLLNNTDYVEKILVEHKIVDNELMAKGTFVLLPSFGWKYVNINKLAENFDTTSENISNIILQRKTEFDSKTLLNDYPITRLDLMTHGIYLNKKKEEKAECLLDDGNNDQSLLTEKGEINLDFLFREREIDIYDKNEEFTPIDDDAKHILKKN